MKTRKRGNFVKTQLRRIAVLAGIALLGCTASLAATSTWKFDPMHSAAQFSVRHLTISTVRGAFSKVSGTVEFDDHDVSNRAWT
jgi:polyisoprenoid-binding protein YceI